MTTTVQKRGELVTGYLTQREVDILAWVAMGYTTKFIAGRFSIAPKTCEKYRAALCRKLNAHCAVDLTRKAVERGVITLDVRPMKRETVNGFARYIL